MFQMTQCKQKQTNKMNESHFIAKKHYIVQKKTKTKTKTSPTLYKIVAKCDNWNFAVVIISSFG